MQVLPTTRSLPMPIIALLLLLVPTIIFSEGFRAETLVTTPTGPRLIKQLAPGDSVISRTETGTTTEAVISAVAKKATLDGHELVIAGETILADKHQRFYVVDHGWRTTEEIKPGDLLVGLDSRTVCIEDVRVCDKKLAAVYMLSVAQHHNFFVGNPPVLAHNISGAELAAAAAASEAGTAAGTTIVAAATEIAKDALAVFSTTGLVVSWPVACAAGAATATAYSIYSLVKHIKSKYKSNRLAHRPSPTNTQDQQELAPVRGFLLDAEAHVKPEIYPQPAASCGYQEQYAQPLRTGACLPELKQPTLEAAASCLNPLDCIEQEIALGSKSAALTPEKMPSCGLQGQTLPSFDSPSDAQTVVDATSAGEQAVSSEAPHETASAQTETKTGDVDVHPQSESSPALPIDGDTAGAIDSGIAQQQEYQAGYATAQLTDEISLVDATSSAAPEIINEFATLSDVLVKAEGRGNSKGRTEPENHIEKLAMDEVMSNPDGTKLEKLTMTDSRWPSEEGWSKYAQNVDDKNGHRIEIHYVYSEKLNQYDDFKFKD